MFLLNFSLWLWYGPEQYARMKQNENRMNTGVRFNAAKHEKVDRIFKN